MRARRILAAISTVAAGSAMAVAVAQPASALPYCDRPTPPPACFPDSEDPPTTPMNSPVLLLDGVRQTTTRDGVRVWGWTADDDAPTTPLSVRITIDGVVAQTLTANGHRPDLPSQYGPTHGFDVTLPTSAARPNVCVTVTNIGSGSNTQKCTQADDIVGFEANSISYDTGAAILTETSLEQLDYLRIRNDTNLQQSTEISGNKTATDVMGWSSTFGLSVSVSTSFRAGFPIFADGKITLSTSVSANYVHNGSQTRGQTFSWRQPVLVPAKSIIEASVAITHATITVPYTLSGSYLYRSGARAAGSVGGMYTGGNSYNLQVTLNQYNLDGTPALAPAKQQAATLRVTPQQ